MKKTFVMELAICITLSTVFPSIAAANELQGTASVFSAFIREMNIGVYPDSTRITYELIARGYADLKSISGTVTLYKKSASGAYQKIDSKRVSLSGNNISHTGSFSQGGKGTFKVTFSGTAYAADGSLEAVSSYGIGSY